MNISIHDRVKHRATTEKSVTELTGPQLPTGKIAKVLFSGEDDLETFWFHKTTQRAQAIIGLNTGKSTKLEGYFSPEIQNFGSPQLYVCLLKCVDKTRFKPGPAVC